jgi:hypothetical protein
MRMKYGVEPTSRFAVAVTVSYVLPWLSVDVRDGEADDEDEGPKAQACLIRPARSICARTHLGVEVTVVRIVFRVQPGLMSCPSTTFCAAVGGANASVYDGARWSTPVPVGDDMALQVVACPAPGTCTAVGRDGVVATLAGGKWTRGVIAGAKSIPTLSCPTATATPSATATPTAFPEVLRAPDPTATPSTRPANPVASLGVVRAARRAVWAAAKCTGDARTRCVLTLALVAGKQAVGTRRLTLAGGASRTVTVKLNAHGRKRLKRARKLRVQLRAAMTIAGRRRGFATRRLTLRDAP